LAGLEEEPGRPHKGEFLITFKGRRTDVLLDGYQVKPEKRQIVILFILTELCHQNHAYCKHFSCCALTYGPQPTEEQKRLAVELFEIVIVNADIERPEIPESPNEEQVTIRGFEKNPGLIL
jgi:hypothetical protein